MGIENLVTGLGLCTGVTVCNCQVKERAAMGNVISSSIYQIGMPPLDDRTHAVVDMLHLDEKELNTLWKRFCMYDKDHR